MPGSLVSSASEPRDHDEKLANPLEVDNEEDADLDPPSDAELFSEAVNEQFFRRQVERLYWKVHRGSDRFRKQVFPKAERLMKSKIGYNKRASDLIRNKLAEMEECDKYAATLKKLEEQFLATETELKGLYKSMRREAERLQDSHREWARMEADWLGDGENRAKY